MNPAQDPNPTAIEPQIRTGSTVPVHSCVACHQVFPQNMMTTVDTRWVCLLCKERALEDPNAKERARYRMSSYVPDYARWATILSIVAGLGYFGFRMWVSDGKAQLRRQLAPAAAAAQATMPWAAKPTTEWPVVAVESSAKFKGSFFAVSPQAVFVQNNDGTVLALTNIRLAPDAPKVDDVTPELLSSELAEWQLGSGTDPLKISKVQPTTETAFDQGIVVLPLPEGAKAPVPTLTVRTRDYRSGAPAFAVVRKADGGQIVYRGHILGNESADGSATITTMTMGRGKPIVFESGDGSATRVHFDTALPVRELRGAALLDSDGLLMAIITAPLAEVPDDGKTKTFLGFGMQALRDSISPPPNTRRAIERTGTAPK